MLEEQTDTTRQGVITMTATATAGYTDTQRTMAREGLEVHDAGCCTPGARCWMAEGLERIVNSEKSTVIVDAAPEAPLPRGNGNSTGGRPVANAATDKQISFLRSLISQLADAPADYPGNTTRDLVVKVLESGETMTKKQASDLIENLKGHVDTLRKIKSEEVRFNRATQRTPQRVSAPAATPVIEGMYKVGDDIVRVQPSKSTGRLYASILVPADGETKGKFEYAPGFIRRITGEQRLTRAQAAEFGHMFHFCACCGRELTHPESVARGIGPICSENL